MSLSIYGVTIIGVTVTGFVCSYCGAPRLLKSDIVNRGCPADKHILLDISGLY